MTTATTKARPKPARTLRVLSRLTDRLAVVLVTEGERSDQYTVSSHAGAVWVSHTADGDRKYRVHCENGCPLACDCPAGSFGKACRHVALALALIARGELERPEGDDRETVRDIAAEAEEQDAFWERGPDRPADDAAADVLGRKLIHEPLPA